MITKYLYSAGLSLLSLMWLPKLFQAKTRRTLKERFGYSVPDLTSTAEMRIWVHAVSVGEAKGVSPLIRELKLKHPDAFIIFSTVTETGLAEAKKSCPEADRHILIPFDLVVRKFVKEARPTLVILSETDFWYNFLDEAKQGGARLVLVNGKMSERSLRFYKYFPSLFSLFDRFIVQNQLYCDRFMQLGIQSDKILISGNLKIHGEVSPPLIHTSRAPTLVIGSTHDPEEKMFLEAVESLWENYPELKVYLVPRHPERFDSVANLIEAQGMSYSRSSNNEDSRLVLVDEMGRLNSLYKKADVCAVAGSWTAKVGGHNILEPCFFGKPVVFGPYMHTQADFRDQMLAAGAGMQVSEEDISSTLDFLLQNPAQARFMGLNGLQLIEANKGALEKTLDNLLC